MPHDENLRLVTRSRSAKCDRGAHVINDLGVLQKLLALADRHLWILPVGDFGDRNPIARGSEGGGDPLRKAVEPAAWIHQEDKRRGVASCRLEHMNVQQ